MKVLVAQSLCDPMVCPQDSPGKNTGVGSQPFPSPGDLPDPGIELMSPALQEILYHLNLQGEASVSVYILTTDLEVKAYYEIQELSSIVILQAFN